MEIKKVYFSQKMSLYSRINQAKQPLPFFQSHQESREAFWRSVKKQCAFEAVSSILLLIKVEKMLFLTTC